jgi:hypothetical protein
MRGLLRRRVLQMAAIASAARSTVSSAAPARQVSPAEALYQDSPKNGLSCAACALFRPPAACVVVAGVISPHGWCRFFDLPD